MRHATLDDAEFVLSLASRLMGAFSPPWFDVNALSDFHENEAKDAADALTRFADGEVVFVAESPGYRGPCGAIHVKIRSSEIDKQDEAYVSILAVEHRAEGQGVGTALLRQAEKWALGRDVRRLTVEVFAGNNRARSLYERTGFEDEAIAMSKPIEVIES